MTNPELLIACLAAAVGAYIIGATPFGYLAGKMKGVDIRQHGSGNVGATNVIRVLGKGIGIPVFALDMCKGWISVMLARWIIGGQGIESTWPEILAGAAAVIGHNYTFWLNFKGGKGIATSAGGLLALLPIPLAAALVVWILLFYTTRYVAVASIGASLMVALTPLALYLWRGTPPLPLVGFGLLLGIMGVWRHRSNIQRLMNGTENRFTKKTPTPPGS